jgi:uncharacterized membrane protein
MNERGSTIPLILGFFLLAGLVVAGSIALGAAFVQQRDLQDICDGAAAAAAASAVQLERGGDAANLRSLRFGEVESAVAAYLDRDPQRRSVQVSATLSADRRRLTLTCEQTRSLVFGALFGHPHLHHVATSSARTAVLS